MSSAARAERSAFRRICTLHAAALDAAAFCMEVTAMTKITIFSGFLGAGKTTLIKKLIRLHCRKCVLNSSIAELLGIVTKLMLEKKALLTKFSTRTRNLKTL